MSKPYTFSFKLTAAGGPFDDPALLATPENSEVSVLFDSGTLHGLKTRDLQRIRWLFLSHLHIDHLIGFDHLLRVRLFSDLPLTIYGPKGTCDILAHRLQGYAWNLTSGSPFVIRVFELDTDPQSSAEFLCHHSFARQAVREEFASEAPTRPNQVKLKRGLSVSCHGLRHGVPCLGYRMERWLPPRFSLETAKSLGLTPGPWVSQLVAGQPLSLEVGGEVRCQAWLAERLLQARPPHSLGYLTDTQLDQSLTEQLAEFFAQVTVLCCEAAYLEEDAQLAQANLHMTTTQVAVLANECSASALKLFHFSRRYMEEGPARHLAEVGALFEAVGLLPTGTTGKVP